MAIPTRARCGATCPDESTYRATYAVAAESVGPLLTAAQRAIVAAAEVWSDNQLRSPWGRYILCAAIRRHHEQSVWRWHVSGLISGLAGAGGAANQAGSYYQNALNQEINAAGSPAATDFARLQMATLRPEISSQNDQLLGTLAATGLGGSGAGRSLGGNVASNEASTLAGVTAPLYQDAMNTYGSIDAAMPGAQNQAYQNAIQQFYQAISMAGQAAAGIPPNAGAPNYGNFAGSPDSAGPNGYSGQPYSDNPYSNVG